MYINYTCWNTEVTLQKKSYEKVGIVVLVECLKLLVAEFFGVSKREISFEA